MATTYYVHDLEARLFIGCIRAKSRKAAIEALEDFGPDADLYTEGEARESFKDKDVGCDDSLFWAKSSQYGVVYRCKVCGKKTKGLGSYNHWPRCPLDRREKS